jgi:NADH-ubiquinone oxidoreductase chain 6
MYLNVKSILIEILIINAICSAILVIISKNPVISVIFLISLVLNSALFLVVKGMPFLGISYILIYLGAIIVLFLFVIMMINVRLTDILETGTQYTKNIPLALTVSGLFLYEFFNVLPAFLNSPILSLDDSVLINLSKEIVLTLNSFFVNGFSAFGVKDTGLNSLLYTNTSILNGDSFNFGIHAVPLISNIN